MSTLRLAARNKAYQARKIMAVSAWENEGTDSSKKGEESCRFCRHRHRNKHCFKQHPELAPKRGRKKEEKKKKKKKDKATARVAIEEPSGDESNSDSDSENMYIANVAKAASSHKFKTRLLYDTGPSHHFVPNEKSFF